MEETNIWIIGVVALVIGALIGYLFGRSGSGSSNQEHELEQAKLELDAYKEKVSSHFEETAELVNKMTESYRGVYQHLATGAAALCDADTARSIESSMQPQLTAQKDIKAEEVMDAEELGEDDTAIEPPRDYAPKKPDQEGTLSENYGVKDKAKKLDQDDSEEDQEIADTPAEEHKKS